MLKTSGNKSFIVKSLKEISGKYSYHQVFADWVECCALAIQNSCTLIHNKLWERRERKYIDIINKYPEKDRLKFGKMYDKLVAEFDRQFKQGKFSDLLGEIYMSEKMSNKYAGQVFTPYSLSMVCAELASAENGDKMATVHEPSCGGGAMVIALAESLMKKGINFQQKIKVIAQDLDLRCVYMCYVQLSLLGINAVVVQGNTLTEPYRENYPAERTYRTPKNMGLLI